MKIIIAKNNTATDIYYSSLDGIVIPASDQFLIHEVLDPYKVASSDEFLNAIVSGTITINDGTSDLSPEDGEGYLQYAYKNHTHPPASGTHNHDDSYYTESEINNIVSGIEGANNVGYIAFGDKSDTTLTPRPLRTVGGSYTGYNVPSAGVITSMGIVTDISNSNTYNILKNGSEVYTLHFNNTTSSSVDNLSIPYNKDDILNMQLCVGGGTNDITAAYTPDQHTLFLAHFDGDDEALMQVTNSSTTAKGMSGRVSGADLNYTGVFNKCVRFDNDDDDDDDYIQFLHHSAYDVQDCTIEFFFKSDSHPSSFACIFAKDSTNAPNDGIYLGTDGNKLDIYAGGATYNGTTLTTDTWYHLAVVMGIGGLKIFLDGTLVGSNSTTIGLNGNYELITVGASNENSDKDYFKAQDYFFDGRIDELRISNSRRYETNFTTPSAEFTNDVNTIGLWHFNETSGKVVYDSSDIIHNAMMMATGSMCQIKTDHIKFGTHSIKMNGSRNDWLRLNHNEHYESLEITVEAWVYPHKDSHDGYIFYKGDCNTEGRLSIKWKEGSDSLEEYIQVKYYGGSTYRTLSTPDGSFTDNEWHHIAVVLHADYIKVFVDGTQQVAEGLTADFQNVWTNNKDDIYIAASDSRAHYAECYLDEVRISNTVRSYTEEVSTIKEVAILIGVE